MSLEEYQAMVGDNGSFVGNPKFTGSVGFGGLVGRGKIDFSNFFANDPDTIERGIGLQPEAFKDFWFNKTE